MGRNNKSLEGAFTSIAGNTKMISAMEQFISQYAAKLIPGEYSLANVSPAAQTLDNPQYPLAKYLAQYKEIIADNSAAIQILTQLEVVIMQLSARAEMKDIKIYFNKGTYIYARCPFYRVDKDVKEIRVILEPISNYFDDGPTDENLAILMDYDKFMKKAYKKIAEAMDEEIKNSVKTYDILKNNLEYSN